MIKYQLKKIKKLYTFKQKCENRDRDKGNMQSYNICVMVVEWYYRFLKFSILNNVV